MKSDENKSSSKKPAGVKKPATTGATKAKASKKPTDTPTTKKTVKKVVAKVADVAEKAVEATKKTATRVRKTAEKVSETIQEVKKAATAAAPKAKAGLKKKALAIPAILLEGDQPAAPSPSGPGQRYALGPTPPSEHFPETGELPESYGTRRLVLAARDPHWLYAHWDFTREQLNKYNGLSADGHLVLRVYEGEASGTPMTQVHVHPESRNWFVHVGKAATKYMGELGYYDRDGKWVHVTTSGATLTPPDALSEDTSVRYATIPVDVPFEELLRIVKAVAAENVPLAEAIQQLRAAGFENLPAAGAWISARWTPQQEQALASLVTMDQVRRVWIGSLEITELVRRHLVQEVSSLSAAQLQIPSSISLASLSSPFGGMERRKGFWFNVNAELIIYGATEPDATVKIGDRQIKLRPDGTFSYRFVLPDGNFDLPAQATSADGDDTRSAALKFSRRTDYRGEVGAHPQDPNMKPPLVENVS